jgi:acylphosphatase
MSAARLFTIKGRVQGVWFRESTRRVAEPLGITGYAHNLPNGDVEVLACGEEDALDELARWLDEGPRMAQVDEVIASAADWQELEAFTSG